jgi:hypothetical protein
MAITPARERVRKSRERKRRGVIPVQVEVSTLEIDFLRRRGMARGPAIRYPGKRRKSLVMLRQTISASYNPARADPVSTNARTQAARPTRSSALMISPSSAPEAM